MTKEALTLALEALEASARNWPSDSVIEAITAIKEALAQPEQDTCKGCNGNGVVGNILDTDTCPFCKGSGVEAQPEQEPVALRHSFDGYGYLYTDMGFGSGWIEWTKRSHKDAEPLYTTPPQRTWVGLTEQQINQAYADSYRGVPLHESIEAKLKEKNT